MHFLASPFAICLSFCLLAYVFDVDICLLMHLLACLHLLMNLITIGLLAFALLRGGCLILGHTWCLCMLDSWLILSCVVA